MHDGPILIVVFAVTLVGIVTGLRVVLFGEVEWRHGRHAQGASARLIGLAFLVTVVAMFIATMSFASDD